MTKHAVRRTRLSRRQFLARLPALVAAGALAACGTPVEAPPAQGDQQAPVPRLLLPSPRPAGTAAPPAVGADLEQFLALSAVLTGFDALSPTLGLTYLDSIQSGAGGAALPDLYRRAGIGGAAPPASVEDLERAGVFDDERTRALADTITEYWYTGVYQNGGEPTVATFVDALVWQAIYTKPNTICGPYPGFWQAPPAEIPV